MSGALRHYCLNKPITRTCVVQNKYVRAVHATYESSRVQPLKGIFRSSWSVESNVLVRIISLHEVLCMIKKCQNRPTGRKNFGTCENNRPA